jgi:hypothetical protein
VAARGELPRFTRLTQDKHCTYIYVSTLYNDK